MMAGRMGNMLSIFLTMESGIGALGAEPPKDFYAATLANSSGWLEALPQGPYTVKTGTIGKIPGLSLGGPYSGHVVYAEGNGEKFPFLSFAHGTGAGGALTLHDYLFPHQGWIAARVPNQVHSSRRTTKENK